MQFKIIMLRILLQFVLKINYSSFSIAHTALTMAHIIFLIMDSCKYARCFGGTNLIK